MNANKPEYLSAEGLAKLKAELDELTNAKRPEIAQRIHDAKEYGDVTENAEYEDAKNEQAFVEGRIQALTASSRTPSSSRRTTRGRSCRSAPR